MPRLAVLGQPVSHSRSPAMHSAALAELGLAPQWTYEAIEVAPDGFAPLVASLPDQGFAGVNVTVPHKLAALAVADEASAAARAVGAANTLSFRDGTTLADNSDTVGILDSLPRPPGGMRALVMGAGGSARAAIWTLKQAGADVHVWNRTAEKAERLATAFGVGAATSNERPATSNYDLILNATTVGLAQGGASAGLEALPIERKALHSAQWVVDLVYGDDETELIAAARAAGSTAVDGLEVLVRQGAASLRLWTGLEPPLETMRAAARGAG